MRRLGGKKISRMHMITLVHFLRNSIQRLISFTLINVTIDNINCTPMLIARFCIYF